ncbi:hypothetical protein [Hahella sp. NBU794]|uniref:hypothetical protein n=1 Tax=Hahella sp. NBU794 TaxID=3422590 RepID=UPI003D6E8862
MTFRLYISLIVIACVALLLIYFPGANGGVPILDDQHVLHRLLGLDGLTWFEGYVRYFSGDVGDLKRPLSYLSFYLQKDSLGEGLFDLKVVNIFIHLINSLLVCWLTYRICTVRLSVSEARWISLFCFLLWAFAPIQVSTVLYITQRMAELAATFTLLALVVWTYVRGACGRAQILLLFGVVSLFALFSTLCKENGFLTLLFIIALDLTVYSEMPRTRGYKFWFFTVVVGGNVLFSSVILYDYHRYFIGAFSARDFNAYERLLTEGRILVEYCLKFLSPGSYKFGLINAGISKSTGIFSPPTTLLSAMFWILSIFFALKYRKRTPYISFGVLFFLCGHSMESSVLSLELYFEHRNYIPIYGVALIFSFCLMMALRSIVISKLIKYVLVLCSAAYLFLIAFVTKLEVDAWANPVKQAYEWYLENPLSERAYSHLGATLFQFGLHKAGADFYQETHNDFPKDPTKELLWYELVCMDDSLPRPGLKEFINKARQSDFYNQTIVLLNALLDLKEGGSCNNLSTEDMMLFSAALLDNPNYISRKKSLYIYQARLSDHNNDLSGAVENLEYAINLGWRVDIALSLAEKYALSEQLDKAEKRLAEVRKWCSDNSFECQSKKSEIDTLSQLIEN